MIVTGGSRGIGAAIAIKAAKAGFDVAVNYVRAKDRAEETVREIEKHGQRGIAVQADVGNEADVLELFRQTDKELGPVTALVNNAAVDYETSIVESDLDRIRQVFDVNIFSVFVSSREAIKRMSTNSGGSGGAIINIGSISARYGGLPGDVPYAASKGAMDSFTLGLSREVGPEGILIGADMIPRGSAGRGGGPPGVGLHPPRPSRPRVTPHLARRARYAEPSHGIR